MPIPGRVRPAAYAAANRLYGRDYVGAPTQNPAGHSPLPYQRPPVVTAAVVMMHISTGFAVLVGCFLTLLTSTGSAAPGDGLVLLVVALAFAWATVNLWLTVNVSRRRKWAQVVVVMLYSLNVVLGVVGLFTGRSVNGGVTVVVSAVVVGLLVGSQAARAHFLTRAGREARAVA